MRKLIVGYLILMAGVFGLLLILGNVHPALAQGVRDAAGQSVAAVQPDSGTVDLSWLDPWAAEGQQMLTLAVEGIPIGLFVLIWTSGAAFVGLAKTGDQKRRWAVGSGMLFGLLASLSALAPDAAITTIALIVLIAGAIVRGLTAGILAALVYELISAKLSPGATS